MFYVYTLCHPITLVPFYVGKGTGRRLHQHLKDYHAGRIGNARKHAEIDKIVAAGLEPLAQIVESYDLESDAFEHEVELIATLPDLTNIRKGGEGWSLSAEEVRRRQLARQKRLWPSERVNAAKASLRAYFRDRPNFIAARRAQSRLCEMIISAAEQWMSNDVPHGT